MPPADHWVPRLRPPTTADAPEAPPAPSFAIEQVVRALNQAVRKEDGPRPRYWEFIPERDENLLITKITATPIY